MSKPESGRSPSRLLWWAASGGLHLAFLVLVFSGPPAPLPEPPDSAHQVELLPDPEPATVAPASDLLPGRAESLRSVAVAKEPRQRFSTVGARRPPSRAVTDPGEPTPFLESFARGGAPELVSGPEERRDEGAGLSRIAKDGASPLATSNEPSRAQQVAGAAGTGASGTPYLWLNDSDRRYADYFRGIYRKVDRLWRFPKSLEVLFEQGDVLVQFLIEADGNVREVRVRKSSGYEQFDQNVVAAIRKAAPFGPIPQGLGRTLRVLAPFEFSNPMVR